LNHIAESIKNKKKIFLVYLSTSYKLLVYILACIFFSPCYAEEASIELKPVIVTSSRIYQEESSDRISTKSKDTIFFGSEKALSHFSVPSVLRGSSLADTRTRGPYGVQTDISLRGAPFEENLVLLDGIGLNDPKSGHHNMDLPVTMFDIKRIDLTYGPASSAYGSGAFGGAVNIIPKDPEDELGFQVSSATGYWDFYRGGVSLNIPIGILKNRSSVEWKRSTGYAPETEFDILTTSSHSKLDFDDGNINIFLGYHTKKFGASTFYSDRYPDEEESVNTGLVIVKARIEKDTVSLAPSFYWKRLQDKFILDRNRPSFSRNDHTSNFYGAELDSQVKTELGNVVVGIGFGNEEIESTNLGEHNRIKQNTFIEYENRILDFLINSILRVDYYSSFGFEFSPSVGIGYEVFSPLTLRAGIARAFRAPTFTELYYSSPANRGNPDLKPERAWTYETGFDYDTKELNISGSIFLRNSESVIDWTRRGSSTVWQVENIGELDMYGIESFLKFNVDEILEESLVKNINVKYAYLQSMEKKGITSKYVLEYLKHNLNVTFLSLLPFDIRNEINFSFKKRIGSEKYFLIDSVFYKDLKLKKGKMTVFLEFSNILNTEYSEQGGVEMPGFSVFSGINVEF